MSAVQGAEQIHFIAVCLKKEMPDALFFLAMSAYYGLLVNQLALTVLCVRTWPTAYVIQAFKLGLFLFSTIVLH